MIKKIILASRLPTLTVGLLSTLLGIVLAYKNGYINQYNPYDYLKIFLILIAAILLQSAVNMMNNYFEEDVSDEFKKSRNKKFLGYIRNEDEILTFKVGIIFYIITALIGIYLITVSGVQLLIIGAIGIFMAYAYAGEPFNYKKFGVGSLMSFIMMGPLMAYGSYYVFSKSFSVDPFIYSFTAGLFIPAILLGNEIRDYEEDSKKGVRTLTVRIGYNNGVKVFIFLILLSYIITIILVSVKYISPASLIVLTTLPLIKKVLFYLKNNRRLLIPGVSKTYMLFSIELFAAIIISKLYK